MENTEIENLVKESDLHKENNHSVIIQKAIMLGAELGFSLGIKKCINFGEWVGKNYCEVSSEKLNKTMWVNYVENTVLVNGSDEHFTRLVNEHGKTIEEVFNEFKLIDK